MTSPAPTGGGQHGRDESPPDYKTPSLVKDRYPQIPDEVPFYRPKVGHQLAPSSWFAVRLNERYHDTAAALEGERSHVRNAALRAEHIIMHPCWKKNPVLLLGLFAAEPIESGNDRLLDACKKRAVLLETTRHRIDVGPLDEGTRYRITGPTEAITKYNATAGASMHFSSKPSHIEGATVATAILTAEQAQQAAREVLVEKTDNILRSNNADRQLTLRKSGVDSNVLLHIGLSLQKSHGALVYLRSYGSLRITLPTAITPATITAIRKAYEGFRVYTDTPLDAWGPARNQPPRSEAFHEARRAGRVIAAISADYVPLPDRFEKLAKALGGDLLEIGPAKFTEAPMTANVGFDTAAWAEAQKLLANGPLQLGEDDGVWNVVPFKFKV